VKVSTLAISSGAGASEEIERHLLFE